MKTMNNNFKPWRKIWVSIWKSPDFNNRRNRSAMILVWIWLISHADDNGVVTFGRNQIARDTGISPDAVYRCLHNFCTVSTAQQPHKEPRNQAHKESHKTHTVITICNFHKWQDKPHKEPHKEPHNHTPSNRTLLKIQKIEEQNIDTNVSSRVSDETTTAIHKLYGIYLEVFNTTEARFKLTPERRNKLRLRLEDAGFDLIAQAIRSTAASAWHRGDNERGWKANLDFIIQSYEKVERLAEMGGITKPEDFDMTNIDWSKVK